MLLCFLYNVHLNWHNTYEPELVNSYSAPNSIFVSLILDMAAEQTDFSNDVVGQIILLIGALIKYYFGV